MTLMKRMIYGQMTTAINKKASKNLKVDFKTKTVKIIGFFEEDKVFVTASDGKYEDTQKLVLSENREQLDIFIGQIEASVNNYHEPIKAEITLDINEKTEEVKLLYFDKDRTKHNFLHKEKY
jgi:hypothetical protein